jgi:large repetitive protein
MNKSLFLVYALLMAAIVFNSCNENEIPENKNNVIDSEITKSGTWTAENEYIISGAVYVSNGAVLTIQPGAIVKFNPGASLNFGYDSNSALIAEGTVENPILFTANSSTPSAGAWGGLNFYSNTQPNTSINHCIIEYGGNGNNEAILKIEGCNLKIDNSIIRKSAKSGIIVEYDGSKGGFTSFTNNTFSDIADHDIAIAGQMIHTIGTGNIFAKSVRISGDYASATAKTWKKLNVPYIVYINIDIDGDLTIEPGAVFKFGPSGYFIIGNNQATRFNAVGSAAEPITFTTVALSSPEAGSWRGFEFYMKTSSNSIMKHCILEYAGRGWNRGIAMYETTMAFEQNTIRHILGVGLQLDDRSGFTSFNNNIIGSTDHLIKISSQRLADLGVPNEFHPAANKGIDVYGSVELASPKTWRKQTVDFYVDDFVYVDGNLTIEAGVTFRMGADGYFLFGHDKTTTITANGTADKPITFTSAATTPAAGNWRGLEIYGKTASNSIFNYCRINFSGKDGYNSIRAYDFASFTIKNSEINHHQGQTDKAFADRRCTIAGTGNNFDWTYDN